VAVPVAVRRPAELRGEVLVGDAELGLAKRRVLELGEVDDPLDLGSQLRVGVVEAGVGHPTVTLRLPAVDLQPLGRPMRP
jgi:hypothetical protein